MSSSLLALIAFLPVITILVLMVVLRIPATKAMPVSWIITGILVLFVWRTPIKYIIAANIKGATTALDILLIVFGAMVLLFTLKESGALAAINQSFSSITKDKRIQAIIISWLFGAFIEGSAGFGTPAALLSPLLVSLGFPAMAAVMVSLIANTTPVSFGPVGVPTIIGLGTALDVPAVHQSLASNGMSFPDFIYQIGLHTAILHSVMAIFVPLLAVSFMTRYFGANRSFVDGLRVWRYAIFAGFCFVVPYLLTAWLLGPEFPSLLGGAVGLAILIPLTKRGLFVPRETWNFADKSQWDKTWIGSLQIEMSNAQVTMRSWKAWLPYLCIAIVLILTRLDVLPLNTVLRFFALKINGIFQTDVNLKFEFLYNPGVIPFIFIALLCIPFYKMTRSQTRSVWRASLKGIKSPFIALIFTVPMVEMMKAGHSPQGWNSMPIVIADFISQQTGSNWIFAAPFIGAFGAFLTGSNTVSNMLFGLFQFTVAENTGLSRIIILSLQNVGGSFGVLICIFKIIAASATVGLSGTEGAIIRKNFIPLLIYGFVTALVALLIILVINAQLF